MPSDTRLPTTHHDHDGFFAAGIPQWAAACELGLNPAVAYLVLARGTGRDNITTRWSAESVRVHAGMSWLRAKDAVKRLDDDNGIVTTITHHGSKPTRKLAIPKRIEQRLWLPNTLVTGAGNELAPILKLRQAQNTEHLQAFIELYGLQDLEGDGGLPRALVWTTFKRERLCDWAQFVVYGFARGESTASKVGPLQRFWRGDSKVDVWPFLRAMLGMGLAEWVDYVAEGDTPDAELIHPLTGDDAARAVSDALAEYADALQEPYANASTRFDYVIPVPRHMTSATVVSVLRLTYRPHTKRTGAWIVRHKRDCELYANQYRAMAEGFAGAAKPAESTSRVVNGGQG